VLIPFHAVSVLLLFRRNSARFVWKRTPAVIKESSPELVAAWKIVQNMWTHDHAGVYKALKGFEWTEPVQPVTSAIGGELFPSTGKHCEMYVYLMVIGVDVSPISATFNVLGPVCTIEDLEDETQNTIGVFP